MHPVYGPAGSGLPGMQGSRDLFRVSKDWENAPQGYQESDAPRALEIKRLILSANRPKLVQETQEPLENEVKLEDESKEEGEVKPVVEDEDDKQSDEDA